MVSKVVVNIIALGVAALVGALIAWFVKSDHSSPHHEQPPRHFEDVPPLHDPTCAICLDNHDVVMLPCEHSFHAPCIREWFDISIRNQLNQENGENGRMVCPTCKFAIPRHMETEYRQRLFID